MSFIYRDKFWYYTINIVLSILILFPILLILILSIKTTTEIRFDNIFSQFTLNNFYSIWDLEIRTNKNTFKQSLFNSLVVTSGTVILSITINVLAGYAVSLLKIPFKNFIFILLILPFLIPVYSIIIPLYILLYTLNLNDNYLGLIIIYTIYIMPIGFFLMFNSFNSIPQSLREVALLNGSSELKILFSIMLPLAIPGLITLVIFAIYISWTDYLLAFIIMNSAEMQMLNVTLSKVGFRSIYPYAGYVISYLPFMIIFILLQKFYLKSIISST